MKVKTSTSALIPDLLRESLRRNQHSLDQPFAETIDAALMFADISGFTDLTESLATGNERGAEDIQRILNEHFGSLLSVVSKWGGSVLKFAGDAVIVLWAVNADMDLRLASRRAAACGLEIQRTENLQPGTEQLSLDQRIVVCAGEICISHVGDSNGKWEFLVGGSVWQQLACTEPHSLDGSVVLSRQARQLLTADVEGNALNDECFAVSDCQTATPPRESLAHIDALPVALVARYISNSTAHQLTSGHQDWIAEFRRIVVMFLKFDGFALSQDSDLETLQSITLAVQTELSKRDGEIIQFLVDDKGLVLLCAWGLALSSHEDDAERALATALDLKRKLDQLNIGSSIGINSGKVFAGLLGNSEHLEYAVIGDTVNTAARLMQAAESGILCDRQTREAAEKHFAFESSGSIAVKGKRELVEAFHPVKERHLTLASSVNLVGRKDERELLDQFLDKANTGEPGGLLHFVGEPGIGKSAIAEYVIAKAEMHGLRCSIGIGDALRRSDSYFAWEPVLADMLGIDAESSAKEILSALSIYPDATERSPLLNALLPVNLAETEFSKRLDVIGRAEYAREFVTEIALNAGGERPLLLLFDDVHWFDSGSWLLLESVCRQVQNISVIILSRPLSENQIPIEVRRYFESARIKARIVDVLSYEDSRELIANRLNVTEVSDDLASRVYERTEGHPLFTEELVLSLQQHNAIRQIEGAATFAHVDEVEGSFVFPDRVEGVIASRISSLSTEEQLTLKVASVLGRQFDLSALAAIRPVPVNGAELAQHVAAASALNLIEHYEIAGPGAFRFRHAIIKDTAHGLLISEQQQRLHQSAAEWYEESRVQGVVENYGLLAHHWGKAGNDANAIKYLELAAYNAVSENANLEVVAFLNEAMARSNNTKVETLRRAEWNHRLGMAEVSLGLFVRAQDHLREAVSVFHKRQPNSKYSAWLLLGYELLAHITNRFWLRVKEGTHRQRMLSAAECYAVLSRIYYNNHELELTIYATIAGTNLAMRAGGDSSVLAHLYANMSVAAVSAPGDHSEYYGSQAIAMCERLQDSSALGEVLMLVGTYEMSAAKWDEAVEHYKYSMEICRRVGEHAVFETALGGLANVFRMRGYFYLAEEADNQLLHCGFDRSVPQVQIWGYYGRACSLNNLNRLEDLANLVVGFEQLLGEPGVRDEVSASNLVAFLANKAFLELRANNNEVAFALIEDAIELIDSLQSLQAYMACTISYLQDCLFTLWRRFPEDARIPVWIKKCGRFEGRCAAGFPMAIPRKMIGKGYGALMQQDKTQAAENWQSAVRQAQRLAIPFDEAQAHYNLSRYCDLEPVEIEHHSQEAQRLLAQLEIDTPIAWQL